MSSYVWPPEGSGSGSSGVSSLNGLTGDLSILAGTGITVTAAGSGVTIAAIGGAAIVETASYTSPSLITTSISIPTANRARVYIAGSGGPVTDPSLGNGSNTQELYLFGTDNTNTVQLDSTSNLILSGTIVLVKNTQLVLHWSPSATAWIEAGRNEI